MRAQSLRNYILRVGIGHSTNELTAFDRALITAGLSDYNLIKVSSILPPRCSLRKEITHPKGLLLPSAFTTICSGKISDTISSAIAVGIPSDSENVGVIMEHSAHSSKDEAEEVVRGFAAQAMQDRKISYSQIVSIAIDCCVKLPEIYCAFASVSMW